MAESGCVRDMAVENLQVNNNTLVSGHLSNNYLKFMLRDYSTLTHSTKTDAEADAGLTLVDGTYTDSAWIGDATCAVSLPKATVGALCVLGFAGVADGGQSLVVSCATDNTFAVQTLVSQTSNIGDGMRVAPVFGTLNLTNATQLTNNFGALTSSHAKVSAAAGNDTLTIATTATNNQTNIGAELGFLCEKSGTWRVSWLGSELGSGAINATFAFSTA